jgi:DNA-binding transcriptional MocR family regulator
MSVPKRRHATTKSAGGATPREPRERASWLPDLGDAGRGKSRALVEALRNAIRHGGLADGECLPSQRTIAARAGVNIATVTKAIAEAARLGLVVTRPGGGTYVVGVRKAASVTGASNGPIDLSLNIPPVDLVKDMIDEALMALARRRRGDQVLGYAPLGGGARDRESGIAWMLARGVKATPDRTLVTNGAYEGLFAALTAVTLPGDVVLTESLNYTGVRRLGDLCRIHLVGIGVDDQGLRPDELDAACDRHSPKAILTTPVTLNPTTATQDLQRRKALIAVAKRRSIMIIEDDIYGRLAGDETPPLAALSPDGVIYVTSLSKCVAPGLRVGYLHAPERVGIRARDALQLTSWTAPSLHAAIATEMIASGLAQACANAHRAEARHRMALAHSVFRKGFVAGPAATYHGWLRLPKAWQEREATTAFHRHGVQVSPAHHFLLGGDDAPAAVRLSLGAVDRSALERALHALAGVLEVRSPASSSVV